MDAQTCLEKLRRVGVLAFATVDSQGTPQVRNISAIHYEPEAIYFFTARGKDFCKELLDTEKVQVLGYTRYKEMIRLTGAVKPVHAEEQQKWREVIFTEQPYLANVYPGKSRDIGIIFCITDMEIEYFNLGVNPIFRESYVVGTRAITPKGYVITNSCIGCGKCLTVCPQKAIEKGNPCVIHQEHCLHCGGCFENCPVSAVKNRAK